MGAAGILCVSLSRMYGTWVLVRVSNSFSMRIDDYFSTPVVSNQLNGNACILELIGPMAHVCDGQCGSFSFQRHTKGIATQI